MAVSTFCRTFAAKIHHTKMNRLTLNLIGIGLTMLLLACCSDRKSKVAVNQIFDESHLSKGERMILKARDEYDFALGDVSGKGVPASLFMAQITRLFLTMAKQGLMPAEICTRMNDALHGRSSRH